MNDDLPASAGIPPAPIKSGPVSGPISTNKEIENAPLGAAEMPLSKEAGRESDVLPKEVTSAGVTIHPTSIPVPPPVAKMGVQSVGANIPMPTATVTLPITDEQIAQGLGKSISQSFRWLAEWCKKRLKQVHMGLKAIHGKVMRVST